MTSVRFCRHDMRDAVGLGLDVGGTRTRWQLIRGRAVLAEGSLPGRTALMMADAAGREALLDTFRALQQELESGGLPAPHRVVAGFSGYSDDADLRRRIEALVGAALRIDPARVRVLSDIVLAFLESFEPGQGCLVYAGTGSIAVCIETDGAVHRAGGRGSLLDDGGSGYWIAREALRHIWRAEDEEPGRWRQSALAACVFGRIGGSDWPRTRAFVYQGDRGGIGTLALAVAEAAGQGDAVALDILRRAGDELARLVRALRRRVGLRPVALAGRVAELHPAVADALARSLADPEAPATLALRPESGAARLAVQAPDILARLPDV